MIKLTDDQKKAYDEIVEWLESPSPELPAPPYSSRPKKILFGDLELEEEEPESDYIQKEREKAELEAWEKEYEEKSSVLYKVLSGYAGTGKTTLLDHIVQFAYATGIKVGITATTNKAVKVLMDRVKGNNYSTIHSVLGIRPKEVEDKEIFEPDRNAVSDPLSSFNLVIVDECSMISEQLLSIIKKENPGYVKVLFCGDPAQLQPINESISKCFSYAPSTLNEVVRHNNTIAEKAVIVRDSTRRVGLEELLVDPEITRVTSKRDIYQWFKGFKRYPDKIRMLSWTNNRVGYWNKVLRETDYGKVMPPFVEGDIIMANKPCVDNKTVVLMNSQEAIVERVKEEEKYHALRVSPITPGEDFKKSVKLYVLKEEFQNEMDKTLQRYAIQRNWSKFWRLKRSYHDIRHCYALTVHKSQGSTFENVVLDWNDIYLNKDAANRNQLVYVGLTRAAHQIIIYEGT